MGTELIVGEIVEQPGPSNRSLQVYANLMGELKERVDLVHDLARDKNNPQLFLYELCQVQVRKICEIIAIGCLAVHDEFSEITENDISQWRASKIISKLERLNAKYFPEAIHINQDNSSKMIIYTLKNSYLTKDELLRIHGSSGDNLHRGSLAKLFKSEDWHPEVDFEAAVAFCNKVKETLSPYHRISVRPDKSVGVLCKMHDPEYGYRPFVDVINTPTHQGPL